MQQQGTAGKNAGTEPLEAEPAQRDTNWTPRAWLAAGVEEGGGCKSTNAVVVACWPASAATQLMKMTWEISSILTMMKQLPVYFLIFGPLAGPVALHPLQAGEFHGNKALGIQTGESTLQAVTTFFCLQYQEWPLHRKRGEKTVQPEEWPY